MSRENRRERRRKKREQRNLRKFGTTPTGEILSRKTAKRLNKYGWDDEIGAIRTKGDFKMLHSNKANRRDRNITRRTRSDAKMMRAVTGNTFGNSFGNMFSSLFGGIF